MNSFMWHFYWERIDCSFLWFCLQLGFNFHFWSSQCSFLTMLLIPMLAMLNSANLMPSLAFQALVQILTVLQTYCLHGQSARQCYEGVWACGSASVGRFVNMEYSNQVVLPLDSWRSCCFASSQHRHRP